MRLQPEHELVLRCARTHLGPRERNEILALCQASLDWNHVVAIAVDHGLAALLHRSLENAGGSEVPDRVLDQLRKDSTRAAAKSLYLTRELLKVVRRLESEGIDVIAFKGPTLAVQAYGELSLRSFADLDILVRDRDVVAARAVLLSIQYASPLGRTPPHLGALIRSGYNDELYRGADGVKVELHWRFAPAYFGFWADMAEIWKRSKPLLLQGEWLRALACEDLLILLCVHGAKHAWINLEGIVAIAELIRRHPEIDWAVVLGRAEETGAARMVRLGVILAVEVLGAPAPEHIVEFARADTEAVDLAAKVMEDIFQDVPDRADDSEYLRLLRFHLATRDGWKDQVRFGARLLMTPTERDWGVTTLPGHLSPLYSVIRPFRLLARVPRYRQWLKSRLE